jgi:hypothetical protein
MGQLSKERHRLQLHLSEAEQITLQEAVHHHSHPDGRERCAALLKIAQGYSPHWVARHGLLMRRDPDSLYQWLRYYQQGGIACTGYLRHPFQKERL